MDENKSEARSVTYSIHLYHRLLAIYPSSFRRDYAGPMLQVFGDLCRRALREAGAGGLLTLWARTALDTVQTALEEHSDRGVDMSKEKFIQLSGWALMAGGLAVMLGWLAGTRPEYNQFNARSLPIDQYANAVEMPVAFLGMLLLSLGFIGVLIRYGGAAGGFGRFSLGFGAVSGLVSAAGVLGLGIYDSDPWWSMFFLGMTFQYLGMALFGLVCLQRRLLPRWNGLPLLAGVWVPLFVLSSVIIEQGTGQWVDWPEIYFYSLWLLSLAGLAGLGYVLQANATPQDKIVQPA